MRSRWPELGRVDKAVSLLGLTVGGGGFLAWAILIIEGFIPPQGGFGYVIAALGAFLFILLLILIPFLSALALLLLPLKPEQRGILGFISLLASLFAMLPAGFFLFALYCTTTHSTCS